MIICYMVRQKTTVLGTFSDKNFVHFNKNCTKTVITSYSSCALQIGPVTRIIYLLERKDEIYPRHPCVGCCVDFHIMFIPLPDFSLVIEEKFVEFCLMSTLNCK